MQHVARHLAVLVGFATATAVFNSHASAQPRGTELERARQEFKERTDAAMQSMYDLFDKAEKVAVNRGDTQAAKILDRQRERFSHARILPSVLPTEKFEKEIVKAVGFVQKAYKDAVADSTRSGDARRASSLKSEVEDLVRPYLFDGRRLYLREGPAKYAIQPDNSWLETKTKGNYVQFAETNRTAEYIELKSKATDIRVRLYADRVSLKNGYYPWGPFKKGRWAP